MLAQAEREQPAHAVTGRSHVGAVLFQAAQQLWVVRTALVEEGPERAIGVVARGGREDPCAGVGGTAWVCCVDHGDREVQARQFVGEREADQSGTDDRHVAALPGHATSPSGPAPPRQRCGTLRPWTYCVHPTNGSPHSRAFHSVRTTPSCPTGCGCTTSTRALMMRKWSCCSMASRHGPTSTAK